MKLLLFVLIPLAAWSAPVDTGKNDEVSDDSLKPLIRTKRADEEIIFGNHQNEARVVKKSDPSLDLDADDDVIENDVKGSDDVNAKSDDDSSENTINDVNKADGMIGEGESTEENNEDNNSLIETDDSETSSGDVEDILDNRGDLQLTSEAEDFGNFYPYVGMAPYLRMKPKQKRGAPGSQLMSADQMSSAAKVPEVSSSERHKRDLTAEELYDWLENGKNGNGLEDDVEYYGEDEGETGGNDEDDEIKELALELLAEEYPEETDNNLDYPIYQDYGEDETESNKEMLSLLDYLEKGTPVLERAPLRDLYPEHIQEEWDDLETDPEQPYEPIVYQGVPGIFIPMPEESLSDNPPIQKRQYLSMLPGQKKRNFYPYHLEPVGGRWGAFVSPEEEKRNAEAYDRLYRLAEALNPRNRDYVDYK